MNSLLPQSGRGFRANVGLRQAPEIRQNLDVRQRIEVETAWRLTGREVRLNERQKMGRQGTKVIDSQMQRAVLRLDRLRLQFRGPGQSGRVRRTTSIRSWRDFDPASRCESYASKCEIGGGKRQASTPFAVSKKVETSLQVLEKPGCQGSRGREQAQGRAH